MIAIFFIIFSITFGIEIIESVQQQTYRHVVVKDNPSFININEVFQNQMIGATFDYDNELKKFYEPSVNFLGSQKIDQQQILSINNWLQNSKVQSNFFLLTNKFIQLGFLNTNSDSDIVLNKITTQKGNCQKAMNITQEIYLLLCFNVKNNLQIHLMNLIISEQQIINLEINQSQIIQFYEIKGQLNEDDIQIKLNILTNEQWIYNQIDLPQNFKKKEKIDRKIIETQINYIQIITLNELYILLSKTLIKILDNQQQLITQRLAQQDQEFYKMKIEYQIDGNLTILMLSNNQLQIFDYNLMRETLILISQSNNQQFQSNVVQLDFNQQFIILLYQKELRIYLNNKKIELLEVEKRFNNAIDCIFQKERNILIVAYNENEDSLLYSLQITEPLIILPSNVKLTKSEFYIEAQLNDITKGSFIQIIDKQSDFLNDPIFTFQNPHSKQIDSFEDLYFDYNSLLQGHHTKMEGVITPANFFKKKSYYGWDEESQETSNIAILCSIQYPVEIYCLQNSKEKESFISIGFFEYVNYMYSYMEISVSENDKDDLLNCQCNTHSDQLNLDILMQYETRLVVVTTNRNLSNYQIYNFDFNEKEIQSSVIIQNTLFVIFQKSNLLNAFLINENTEPYPKQNLPKDKYYQIVTNYLSYPNLLFLLGDNNIQIAQIDQENFILEIISEIAIPNKINNEKVIIKLAVVDGGLFVLSSNQKEIKKQKVDTDTNNRILSANDEQKSENNNEITQQKKEIKKESLIFFYPKQFLFNQNKEQQHFYTLDLQDWNFTDSFLITYSQYYMYIVLEKDNQEKKIFIYQGSSNAYSLKVNSIEIEKKNDPIRINTFIFPKLNFFTERLFIQCSESNSILYSLNLTAFNFLMTQIPENFNQQEIEVKFTYKDNSVEQIFHIKQEQNSLNNNEIQFNQINEIFQSLEPLGIVQGKNNIYILTKNKLYQWNKKLNLFNEISSFNLKCYQLFYDELSNQPFAVCLDEVIKILIFDTKNNKNVIHILNDENQIEAKKIYAVFYKNSFLQIVYEEQQQNLFGIKSKSCVSVFILHFQELELQEFDITITDLKISLKMWKISEFYLQTSNNFEIAPCQIFGFIVFENTDANFPYLHLIKICINNEIAQLFGYKTEYPTTEIQLQYLTQILYIEFTEENPKILKEIIQIGEGVQMKNGYYIANLIFQFSESPVIYELQFNQDLYYHYYKKLCNLRSYYQRDQILSFKLMPYINGTIIGSSYDGQKMNYFFYSNPFETDKCQNGYNHPIVQLYSTQNTIHKQINLVGSHLLTFYKDKINMIQVVNITQYNIDKINQKIDFTNNTQQNIILILTINSIFLIVKIFNKNLTQFFTKQQKVDFLIRSNPA